mgnify:CR=1 FL=1
MKECWFEEKIENARTYITAEFERAVNSPDPDISTALNHEFAPTPITEEKGERSPEGKEPVIMVDAALFAMDEILRTHPEGVHRDIGEEFNLILGIEEWQQLEIEVIAAQFLSGKAFGVFADRTSSNITMQLEYSF